MYFIASLPDPGEWHGYNNSKIIWPFFVELLVSTFMATKSSEIGLTLLAVLLTDFCYCEVTSCFYIPLTNWTEQKLRNIKSVDAKLKVAFSQKGLMP